MLARSTVDGKRVYEHISDGEWWFETERELNGGSLGFRKPFPTGIYIDDTGVTVDGKKTAKPVFAYAGEPAQPLVEIAPRFSLRAMYAQAFSALDVVAARPHGG